MKRIFQILICCILIITLSACGQLTDIYSEFKDDLNASVESSDGEFENEDDKPLIEDETETETEQAGNYFIGDIISFGKYEQDNNSSNGKEDIEWLIIDVSDTDVLLISKHGLDCVKYNSIKEEVTWETCSLRKWLNDTFFNEAFTIEEKQKIISSSVPAEKMPKYNVNPGNETNDNVFILNGNECNKYLSSGRVESCTATEYAIANGASTSIYEDGECWWWMRSPGSSTPPAVDVYFYNTIFGKGVVNLNGYHVDTEGVTVRPVIRINTKE